MSQATAASREIALSFCDRLGAADAPGIAVLLAPHAIWWVSGDPALFPAAGAHKAADILGHLLVTRMTSWQFEVLSIVSEDNRAALEAKGLGIGPGEATYNATYSFHFVIEDGLITEVREYLDTLAATAYMEQRAV